MTFVGMDGDGPGVDRPRQRLAVAVDDVAALGDQRGQPCLAPGMVAEGREVEDAQRDQRDDAGIDQHAEHQPLVHDGEDLAPLADESEPLGPWRDESGRRCVHRAGLRVLGLFAGIACAGSGASGSVFASRTGFVTGLARPRRWLIHRFLGRRWRGFARPGLIHGRLAGFATDLGAGFAAVAGLAVDLDGRQGQSTTGFAGTSRVSVFEACLMQQLRRRRPVGAPRIVAPRLADRRRGVAPARAPRPAPPAPRSRPCAAGWASRASSKPPFEELVGRRRRQGQHLGVPALELGKPAARADLGLEHADVALGEDDPGLDVLERGALRRDAERDQIAAERRAGAARDHEHRTEAAARSLHALLSMLARTVRTALRSRAERARGFAASSRSVGETGLATRSNVGSSGSTMHGTVARAGRRSSAAFAEEALHDPVLEAVKGDDGEPAAGLQRALGGGQPLLELVELGVQMDADRLEGAGRRIALLARAEAGGAADDRGQLGGALDRTGGDDGAGDRAGARLLAIVAQDPGDLGLVGRVQEFGGGQARLRSCACRADRRPGRKSRARLGRAASSETPISSAMASTRPMPRSASTRSIWLKRSSIKVRRGSGTSDRPASIASGSRSKPITRPAPAASMARV